MISLQHVNGLRPKSNNAPSPYHSFDYENCCNHSVQALLGIDFYLWKKQIRRHKIWNTGKWLSSPEIKTTALVMSKQANLFQFDAHSLWRPQTSRMTWKWKKSYPDIKVWWGQHGAHMGPAGGPHVGPRNLLSGWLMLVIEILFHITQQ